MDELVGRLAAKAGIGGAVPENLRYLPGVPLLRRSEVDRRGIRPIGPGIGEIQSIARKLFGFGRDKIGAEHMSEIIAGTPGLSQFA
jgi:hypothetical protein